MRGTFETAFELTMKFEGSEIVDGVRRYGIDTATYAAALGAFEAEVDLNRLTAQVAQTIHRQHFWERTRCDYLPAGLDLVLYDAAVCHGISRSIIWLQSILRDRQDGEVSGRTLTAVNAFVSRYTLVTLINTFKKERLWHIDRSTDPSSRKMLDLSAAMRNRVDQITAKACNLAIRA
jgi:lysozyme family protein